jgi:hypothetical protein
MILYKVPEFVVKVLDLLIEHIYIIFIVFLVMKSIVVQMRIDSRKDFDILIMLRQFIETLMIKRVAIIIDKTFPLKKPINLHDSIDISSQTPPNSGESNVFPGLASI